MKNLKKLGLKELTEMELTNIQGGAAKYFEYTWSNTDNPIIYTAEAVANGAKAVANGVIWLFS